MKKNETNFHAEVEFAESRPLGRLSVYALVLFGLSFLKVQRKEPKEGWPKGFSTLWTPFTSAAP